MFGACGFYDEDPGDDGNYTYSEVGGFKVCYKPESYPYRNYYEDLSGKLLDTLYSQYGLMGFVESEGEGEGIYYLSDVLCSVYCYDDSVLIYSSYKTDEYKWSWSGKNGEPYILGYKGIIDCKNDYLGKPKEGGENQFYRELTVDYTPALQTAILQIVLGKTPDTFENVESLNGVSEKLGTATLSGDEVIATGLKKELQEKGTYVGLTSEDQVKIEEYILKNVIGENKFKENNSKNHFSKEDYRKTIQKVWKRTDILITDEVGGTDETYGNMFIPYPATLVKDYNNNEFYIGSTNPFGNIPAKEYQSLILMPKEELYLSEVWLSFVSEENLNINVYYRYYDSNTKTLVQGKKKKITAGSESSFDIYATDSLDIDFKNINDGDICHLEKFSDQASSIDDCEKYYKMNSSLNGFGSVTMIDEQRFKDDNLCSFLEIVFDVEKKAGDVDKDYSFKVALSSLWLAPEEDVEKYKADVA